ncbi:MAG: phosphate ABC transporter permease subunit PstC [Candidatus Cloacimonetes bacterium]|nr:phosphate ABC transporter permease subunit PstC [Candidatus Cloacimonadota bacterium]
MIVDRNGCALAVLDIQAEESEAGKIIKFAVYDHSYNDVFTALGVAVLDFSEEIGELDYPILCETGSPYVYPRQCEEDTSADLASLEGNNYIGGEPQIFLRPWLPLYTDGAGITTAYCEINIDGKPAAAGDEVGAFVNGECRGTAIIDKKGKKSLAILKVFSFKNEIIQFAVWDAAQAEVIGTNFTTSTNPGGEVGNSPDIPLIVQYFSKLTDFIFGSSWHPTSTPGSFGILTLIVGSLLVTLGALVVAVPFGVGSAIYISEIASPRMRELIKPVIELLAGIPSVVYGLFGMAFLAPMLMKWFHLDAGLNILNASIILGIMVIPIISSMSEDALSMVPKNLRHASYGLGANRWETIIKVILPAAKTGVISSILLGFGRAIGETMVVIMVAGGSPQFPDSIFQSVRPMTSAIAAEMGETAHGTMHFHALYGIAAVLFIITFMTNLISELVFHRQKQG